MNEIKVSASLDVTTSVGIGASLARIGLLVDQTGTDYGKLTQVVGTSEELLALPSDIAAGGFILMINRSASATVRVRAATGLTDLIIMNPGEPALFRIYASATPYVIASASAQIEFLVLDA